MDVPHLRYLRQQAALSQEDLAKRSGLGRDTVSKLETGQRRAHPSTVHKLAAGLEVEPQVLIAGGVPHASDEQLAQRRAREGEHNKKAGS